MEKIKTTIDYIRHTFKSDDFIPLHEPVFFGNEKQYLIECIDSSFVSYLGKFVNKFEKMISDLTGAEYSIAMVNGTSALHMALLGVGVGNGHEVLTQALSFVATPNAISYCGAKPVFLDSSKEDLGMSTDDLQKFFEKFVEIRNGKPVNISTGNIIGACVPVHVFGHPVKIEEIVEICSHYKVPVVEDAAEAIGSYYKKRHVGTFGETGVFSFNGNKTITCGGGGVVVTRNEETAKKILHLSTTAKLPHKWDYIHDQVGFNYRMPNLNAAVACAQIESLPKILEMKRQLAFQYKNFFENLNIGFFSEKENCKSNYWLNAIFLENKNEKERFLEKLNESNIMCRPTWTLLNQLPPFKNCQASELKNAKWIGDHLINIPSSSIPLN